jgi:hypothetical protein
MTLLVYHGSCILYQFFWVFRISKFEIALGLSTYYLLLLTELGARTPLLLVPPSPCLFIAHDIMIQSLHDSKECGLLTHALSCI